MRDESLHDLLDYYSGYRDNESDVLEYRRTTDLSSTDMHWLDAELYALLASKTCDVALGAMKSFEEVEVKGIIGWQRLEREARGYHRQGGAYLTESVTHLDRVSKVTDLPRAIYRWESRLKEVDPWTAVELVLCLCAVSLNSSCEDLSEPERMTKGRQTQISQSGGPRDFAHVNKFSILATMTTNLLVTVVLQLTREKSLQQRLSVNSEDTMVNDGCDEARETSFPSTTRIRVIEVISSRTDVSHSRWRCHQEQGREDCGGVLGDC